MSLGNCTQVLTRKKIELSLCSYVLQTTSQKEFNGGVRTGCKEKRAGRAKLVVFQLLIGLIAVTVACVVAPKIYRCA